MAFDNQILKKYMDLRLRWFKSEQDDLELPGSIQKVRHILLITPEGHPELELALEQFASQMYKIFENVQVSTFERSSFRPQDGNWFGLPKEEYLDNFRQENFDLVIDLNLEPDRLCTYISALSGAPLRMNLVPGKYDHVYNVQIRTTDLGNAEYKMDKLLDYLKRFNIK